MSELALTLQLPPQYKELVEDLRELKHDFQNPNRMTDREKNSLWTSLQQFGWIYPIITNKDGLLADGEQRVDVCLEHNEFYGPVLRLPVKDVSRRLLRQVLNKLRGEHNFIGDALEFQRISEQGYGENLKQLIGLSDTRLAKYIDAVRLPKKENYTIPDAKTVKTEIVRGDVYALGPHRLMCGDATDRDDVAKLMNGNIANLHVTDPPYNIGKTYSLVKDDKQIYNYMGFCTRFFALAVEFSTGRIILTPGKQNLPLWLKNTHITDIGALFSKAKLRSMDIGLWFSSNKMSGSRIANLALWEPILFYGDFDRESRAHDIFDYNVKRQKHVGNHPCPKIVSLYKDIVEHYSLPGQLIADFFGGSGSTLIACEQTQRICYIMDIDPRYCQIMLDRWQTYTHLKAEKLNDGGNN